ARKAPNQLSLFDLSGNVWEWCQDAYVDDVRAILPGGGPTRATDRSGCCAAAAFTTGRCTARWRSATRWSTSTTTGASAFASSWRRPEGGRPRAGGVGVIRNLLSSDWTTHRPARAVPRSLRLLAFGPWG